MRTPRINRCAFFDQIADLRSSVQLVNKNLFILDSPINIPNRVVKLYSSFLLKERKQKVLRHVNNIYKTSMDSRWYNVIDHEWNAEWCAKQDDKFNETFTDDGLWAGRRKTKTTSWNTRFG